MSLILYWIEHANLLLGFFPPMNFFGIFVGVHSYIFPCCFLPSRYQALHKISPDAAVEEALVLVSIGSRVGPKYTYYMTSF